LFPSYTKKTENNKLNVEQKLLTSKTNVTVDLDKCTGCGVCIDACPEEAITEGPLGALGRGKAAKTTKIDIDPKKCSYCGVCNVMCPFDAIKVSVNGEKKIPIIEQQGFPTLKKNATIDQTKCTHCVLCEEVCPRDAIKRDVAKVDQGHKASSTTKYEIDFKLDEDKCTLCGICAQLCDAYKLDYKEPTPLTVKKIGKLTHDATKCDFCQLCMTACPEEALKLERKVIETPKLSGKVDIDLDDCITCGWCQTICPRDAAKVEKIFEGKYELVTSRCPAGCSTCVEVCPANALYIPPVEEAGQKPGKLMWNEDFCMFCGACVNACPADGTIKMKRTKINFAGEETSLSKKVSEKLMAEKTPKIKGA